MKKKTSKAAPQKVPRLIPKIHPKTPVNVVSNLFDALAGKRPFILLTDTGDQILVDRGGVKNHLHFLGMLELAKK